MEELNGLVPVGFECDVPVAGLRLLHFDDQGPCGVYHNAQHWTSSQKRSLNFPDIDAVYAQCRAKLEANFVPSYLQVVDQIPKTASEKPQERLLIADFDPDASSVHAAS